MTDAPRCMPCGKFSTRCPRCDGTGIAVGTGDIACSRCHGDGVRCERCADEERMKKERIAAMREDMYGE